MKNIIGICGFLLIFSMLSCGRKSPEEQIPQGKKMALEIKNNTGAVIEKVVMKPSSAEAYSQTCRMEKGGSYIVSLAQYDYYGIILIDTQGHHYGKEKLRWVDGSAELIITQKDFVSQGPWDTIKKTLGL